jgi:hypothetical protein
MSDNRGSGPYEKNTKEQYEALGRFVEAFEAMVDEVRESTIALMARDPKHGRLIKIALHHEAFSAKPLFNVFRAVIVEIIDDAIAIQKAKKDGMTDLDPPLLFDILDEPLTFTPEERDCFLGVLRTLLRSMLIWHIKETTCFMRHGSSDLTMRAIRLVPNFMFANTRPQSKD